MLVDSSKGIELIEVKSKKLNENEAEIKEKNPYLDFIKNGKTMIQNIYEGLC